MRTIVTFVLSICLLHMLTSPAHAFELRYHHNITVEALSFLNPYALVKLSHWNQDVDSSHGGLFHDTRISHAYHFDNCLFLESTRTINELYGKTLRSLNPTDPE